MEEPVAWLFQLDSGCIEEPILDAKQRPYVFEHCIPGYYISSTSIFFRRKQFPLGAGCICPDLVEKEKAEKSKDAYDDAMGMK